MTDLSRDEVLNRLEILAGTKTGDPMPDWLAPNGWGTALAARAADLLLMKARHTSSPILRSTSACYAVSRTPGKAFMVSTEDGMPSTDWPTLHSLVGNSRGLASAKLLPALHSAKVVR
jgi:hypothetical protein